MESNNKMRVKDCNKCPRCGSPLVYKYGNVYSVRRGIKVQKFRCNECKRVFRGLLGYYQDLVDFDYKDQPLPPTDWIALTKSQSCEKKQFMEILEELLLRFKVVSDPHKKGRKYSDFKDMAFCLSLKTYTRLSSRRLHSDLEQAKLNDFIAKVPHFTTLMNYLEKEELTELLQGLIRLSALAVKPIESQFAADSSGFSTSQFGRWFDYKYNEEKTYRNWVKAHVMVGTLTNMVTSVELTKAHGADCPRLVPLVEKTCKDFNVQEVSADKAYLSRKNLEVICANGAVPFIPFKKGTREKRRGSQVWQRCFLFFKNQPQEYLKHYHRRSNVETTFSMIKQKFGKDVVSRSFQSQTNEVLLKILCHNICCLIREYYENRIESYYSTEQPEKEVVIKIG